MNIGRPQNWPSLLAQYAADRDAMPFEWGINDCVHFAAGWMRALGYPDPLAGFGQWDSALSAAREIKRHGGFGAAVAGRMAILGCPIIPVATAQRGDIVLLQIDSRRKALAVVIGYTAIAPGPTSQSRFAAIPNAVCAWSI
jgi:hypothetical protein